MQSRERVYAALRGQAADRLPHNFRAWGNVLDLLRESLGLTDREAVLKWAGSDVRDRGGLYGFLRPGLQLDAGTDIWGVRRERRSRRSASWQPTPLASRFEHRPGLAQAHAYVLQLHPCSLRTLPTAPSSRYGNDQTRSVCRY